MNAKPWSQEIQDGINQEMKKAYGPFITDRPELYERGIVSKMPGKRAVASQCYMTLQIAFW
jgi:hypothetical protein